MGKYVTRWKDSDGDNVQVSYPVVDALADGSDYTARTTALTAFRDAILAVQIDPSLQASGWLSTETEVNSPLPTDSFNQKTIRWLIEYTVDGLTGVYTEPVPCANFSLGTPSGGVTIIPLGAGVGATLKATFEAVGFVPEGVAAGGTGAVTVIRIYGDRT